MTENNLKSKTLMGFFWKYIENGGTQIVQFIIQLILARILTPADYGIVGIILVFISFANVFVTSGFGSALIQKKDADEKDFSSVFYLSMIMSVIFYIILFFASPYIAVFYQEPMLKILLRVQSIVLFIIPMNSIQNAVLSRRLEFKKSFYRNFGAAVLSGIIGIILAYVGFGIWALVISNILNYFIGCIILCITVKWRPSLCFEIKKVIKLFTFGWKLLCSSLLDNLYNNFNSLIIGKFFTKDILGYYNRGKSMPSIIVNNINGSISGVLFPALSQCQNDIDTLKSMVRRSITTTTFLIFPLMAGLAAVAHNLTIILLTEKWILSVPFVQLLCFVYAFYPVSVANLQTYTALGRSDIFLKLEIIKKIITFLILIFSVQFGVYAMVIGECIGTLISVCVNSFPNKKMINYGLMEQIKDYFPAFILAIFMFVVVSLVQNIKINLYLNFILQLMVGVVIYIGGALIFRFDSLGYIFNTVKNFVKRRK